MHAVFITYTSSVKLEDLKEPYAQYARALAGWHSRGFVAKTWLANGDTHGGFHLFRDREVADRYLAEMFEPDVATNSIFSNIRVERYDVNEEMSRLTNGLAAVASAAA